MAASVGGLEFGLDAQRLPELLQPVFSPAPGRRRIEDNATFHRDFPSLRFPREPDETGACLVGCSLGRVFLRIVPSCCRFQMADVSFHGLLVVDKPRGLTSRAVVDRAKGWFPRGTRLGHTGTLDPLATGVLVLGVGAATRLTEYVQRMAKTYRA